ncbi:hypothetical protein [Bdellovibrio sp. NC01]|uniref:hypothetical protein n=1 Tax=Bdellovibrio sp. NC01 TaxID=2220073 RepID=UPI00115938D3|nr:hypothetical protein [Bdellovibrio sp. NC01]QDK39169.1 hypothetical protein DOE51_17025 [Bdellovibrio sp. NC01]
MKKKAFVFGMVGLMVSTALATTTSSNSGSDGVENGTTTTSTTPAVTDSANQSSSGNGLAQAVNYVTGGAEVVMGGVMIKTGSASHNYGEVAMGVLMVSMGLTNIAQGSDHGAAASSADTTGFQTDGYGSLSSTGTSGTTDATVAAALADPNYQAVGSTLKALEASGVYNPKTGSFTVGDKTYSSSDLASTSSMADAGIPQSTIDSAMALSNDLEKKALAKLEKVKANATAENGYEEGSGSNNRAIASSEEDNTGLANTGKNPKNGLGKNSGVDPTLVAGLTKNYNGEPIGVAADNIFSMVSRRYKLKESQESFIDPKALTTTAQNSK